MKTTGLMMLAGAAVVAVAFARADEPLSDDAMKERIVRFVTLPSRLCGHALVDFRDELRGRKLTNRSWFDGDTNRLARLIAELAQTNDVELSSLMVESLGEYGTAAQLSFLYSCATNTAVGDKALRSVFAIEGVTSNSVSATQSYLFMTNGISYKEEDKKSETCIYLLKKVYADSSLTSYRPAVLAMALDFQRDVELMPNVLDMTLCDVDTGFRFSKRRLGILRNAFQRVSTKLEPVAASTCYVFQTNYLANAINELVAYPEANLPD